MELFRINTVLYHSIISTAEWVTTLCVPFHALNSQCEVLIFGTHIGVAFYCSTTNFETILISTLGVKMRSDG